MTSRLCYTSKLSNFFRFRAHIFLAIGMFLTASVFIDPNYARASDPTVLAEIDLINGGFRDLSWGRHISDCKNMVYETHKQTSGGNIKLYTRKNDKLILDNKINLSRIEYGFLNSQLLFVAIQTLDPEHKQLFKETVILRFGNDKKKEEGGNLFWVADNTNIIFQPGNSSKPTVLMLVSKKDLRSNFNK